MIDNGSLYGIEVPQNQGISTQNMAHGQQIWHTNRPFYAIWTVFIGGWSGLQFVDPEIFPRTGQQSCILRCLFRFACISLRWDCLPCQRLDFCILPPLGFHVLDVAKLWEMPSWQFCKARVSKFCYVVMRRRSSCRELPLYFGGVSWPCLSWGGGISADGSISRVLCIFTAHEATWTAFGKLDYGDQPCMAG